MFENLVTNFKIGSTRLSESLSVENLKQSTSRLSEKLDSLKSSVIGKTYSISSYLSKDLSKQNGTPKKSFSTSHLSNYDKRIRPELKWPVLVDNRMEWVNYQSNDCEWEEEEEAEDSDIIDRFVRVINLSDDSYDCVNRNRRNDREEIRRRLATGCDTDEYYGGDRPGKKPSLQARLQSGMNLQICFMNETMSDTESPCSESVPNGGTSTVSHQKSKSLGHQPDQARSLNLVNKSCSVSSSHLGGDGEKDQERRGGFESSGGGGSFFERQARLQAEARVALAQAKDLARMQMQAERQAHQVSPITHMLRASLLKVGISFPEGRRRVSRQMLTDMNVAQLQVIVNDLHTQIEQLNEGLVKYLMERDELHMSQDSMLVDIEDLTRYLGAKENLLKEEISQNNNLTPMPSGGKQPMMMSRIVSIGKK